MYDFKLQDGIIVPSEKVLDHMTTKQIYDFLRTNIYDGLIPVVKIIGFKIVNSRYSTATTAISRNISVMENNIEIAKNLGELLLVDRGSNIVSSREAVGKLTTNTTVFVNDGNSVVFLNDNTYLMNATTPIKITCAVHENTGYKTMEDNSKLIKNLGLVKGQDDSYFPLNTDHTLMKFIKILPFFNNELRYNLATGIRSERVEKILNRAAKEEFSWL